MTYDAIIEYLINELGYTHRQAEREIQRIKEEENKKKEEK